MYLNAANMCWKLQRKFLCKNARTQHKHWFLAQRIVIFDIDAFSFSCAFSSLLSLLRFFSFKFYFNSERFDIRLFVCFVLLEFTFLISCVRRRYLLSFVGMSHNLSLAKGGPFSIKHAFINYSYREQLHSSFFYIFKILFPNSNDE